MAKKATTTTSSPETQAARLITNAAGRERDPLFGLAAGRVVHYVTPQDRHRPAMVVHVVDRANGVVNLQVFNDGPNDGYAPDNGTTYQPNVLPHLVDSDHASGSWHWPERAE